MQKEQLLSQTNTDSDFADSNSWHDAIVLGNARADVSD